MPFTVSHIVAALPLNKRLDKYTALSPLVIGSMTPDIAYLTPFLVYQRIESHSLIGIYLFCIPMGLTIYYLYHLLMAPVIVSFLPSSIQRHLDPDLLIGKLPTTPAHVLLISLVLGALTHIIWDFFTHQTGIPQHLTWLNNPLINIDGYDIRSYRLLQHLSSILGLGLLIYWIRSWYKSKKHLKTTHVYWQAPSALKTLSISLLIIASTISALANGFRHLPDTDVIYGMYSAQVFIKFAFVGASGASLLCCFFLGFLYRFSYVVQRKNL